MDIGNPKSWARVYFLLNIKGCQHGTGGMVWCVCAHKSSVVLLPQPLQMTDDLRKGFRDITRKYLVFKASDIIIRFQVTHKRTEGKQTKTP